ncbi:helix-turn-helix domain-containing protein [Defluviimonas sp. D31]|uniref:helix-turn-helix domain-containing protein n=1 Tax=Defluviimonas sp. D31 TaxID=3083253 RepID=UPI00296EDB3D|nr:helix-turn-helix domain-containing protein [Defluviimonas sp. D31]MDW4550809.1 helix-turn-helix domain-containing protein [Defluviimonas sp. D31]
MQSKLHVDRVITTVNSSSAAAHSPLAASWRRSAKRHGLDPSDNRVSERLGQADIECRREQVERFMRVATPRLDHLFGLVGLSGCGVFLTDEAGLVLDRRVSDADATAFDHWGLGIGSDWSEASEGTNGIGTCLAEKRRVTIHRDEHFFVRNIGMSCLDAPIFGPDGALLAALDVSSARVDHTEAYNRLIGAMVAQAAQAIEADFFRASFPDARIVVADCDGNDGSVLLAVDGDDLIVGATRGARRTFGLEPNGALKMRPASDVLGRGDGPAGFEKAERAAVIRALARADGNISKAARGLGIGRATLYRRMKRLGIGE